MKLGAQKTTIPCGNPKCSAKITITLDQAISGGEVTCGSCGCVSVLRPRPGNVQARRAIDRLGRALDDLGAAQRPTSSEAEAADVSETDAPNGDPDDAEKDRVDPPKS